jgi:hypothetical protein
MESKGISFASLQKLMGGGANSLVEMCCIPIKIIKYDYEYDKLYYN